MSRYKQNQQAILLVLVLLCSVFSPVLTANQISYDSANQTITPIGENSIISALSENITIPKNHSIDSAEFHIEPVWEYETSNGTYFNSEWGSSFSSGVTNQTSAISSSGDLTLATNSSLGSLTDFETSIQQAVNWFSTGKDNTVWIVENLSSNASLSNLASSTNPLPTGATNSHHALSTSAEGLLEANSQSCLNTPRQVLEMTAFELTLSFDYWSALADSDITWIDFRVEGGSWNSMSPVDGYTSTVNSSHFTTSQIPQYAWNGSTSNWTKANFNLSSYLNPITDRYYELRFCFATSTLSQDRASWFVDNISIYDAGTPKGAWLHGNLSGDYSPNAEAWLKFPIDLSQFTNNSRLYAETNWDMEGGNNDQMTTWISLDNGSNWILLSPYPGHPGFGVAHNGLTYIQESFQWIPVQYSIPPSAFSHANSSNAILGFLVQTDNIKNHGGNVGSGWEGMMIDDIAIIEDFGLPSEERHVFMEFNETPTYQNGSATGWSHSVNGQANDWQYITSYNAHDENWRNESFEFQTNGPAGWTIQTEIGTGWSIGPTSNSSGWGPGYWPSGSNGAGIVLNNKYEPNTWTHLISPTYVVPENSTARVSFKSWVCTEPNWDGGAVSLSVDDGDSWWFIPLDAPNFHDRRSSANVYSPLFGEGIFDGSQVTNGCLNPHQFASKSTDVSNLSGQEIRVRFSFFSDTYVESHGWYIDDAGVEVDVFEQAGDWTSPAIYPNPSFGYGIFDGQISIPNNTAINFSLLDQNGVKISDLYLGQPIDLDPLTYPSLRIQAEMFTSDWLVTPRIQTLGLGSNIYLGPGHILHPSTQNDGLWNLTNAILDANGEITSSSINGIAIDLNPQGCLNNGLSIIGEGIIENSVKTIARDSGLSNQTNSQSGFNATYAESSYLPDYNPSIFLSSNSVLSSIEVTQSCIANATEDLLTEISGLEIFNTTDVPMTFVQEFGFEYSNLTLNQSDYQSLHNFSGYFNLSFRTFVDSDLDSYRMVSESQLSQDLDFEKAVQFVTSSEENTNISGPSVFSQYSHIFGTKTVTKHKAIADCSRIRQINSNFDLADCKVSIMSEQLSNLSIYDFTAIGVYDKITITPNLDEINEVYESKISQDQSNSSFIDLQISTSGDGNGHSIGWNITSSPKMIIEITEIPTETWLPQTKVRVSATATREIPYTSQNNAPAIDYATIKLSNSSNLSNSLVTIEFVDISENPRIRQTQGVGLAQFNESESSISCANFTCDFDLVLESTWLLDEIEQSYWFFSAWDADGLNPGPVMDTHISISKSVINNVELFNLQAFDDYSNNLVDSSQQVYPAFMSAGANISVSADVRFTGINSGLLEPGLASITFDIIRDGDSTPISSASVENGINGRVTAILSVPSSMESGDNFSIVPTITRCGIENQPTSCTDETGAEVRVNLRFDDVAPRVDSMVIIDSGFEYPADGHIMMEGQDIALRAQVSDDMALAGAIRVWSWLEAVDDLNSNGLMEESEYNSQVLQIQTGATNQTIDLPLFANQNILPPSANQGRLSVAITGLDYARNPFFNSGEIGNETLDLATIYVQRRAITTVANDFFSLDSVGGLLLPGKTHTFSMQLTDGNGFESLDSINLMLAGRETSDVCYIQYNIPLQQYDFDEDCFLRQPRIRIQQQGNTQTYNLNIDFEITWEKSELLLDQTFFPGVIISDEGQDLGLGLTQLTGLEWSTQVQSELRLTRFQDTVSPYGQENDGVIYVNRGDLLRFEFDIFYANTSVEARNIPHNVSLDWRSNDGFSTINGSSDVDNFGRSTIRIPLETQDWTRSAGMLYFDSTSWQPLMIEPLSYSVVIDENVPRLVIPPGEFTEIRSDEIENFLFNISVQDAEYVQKEDITMYWQWTRAGLIIDSTNANSYQVPLINSETNLWQGRVDLNPRDFGFERGDHITIWFDAFDMSGKRVQGIGSMEMPLNLDYRIISFEPVITSVIATPYRANYGDIINITVDLENQGVLPGTVNLSLVDQQGNVYQTFDQELVANEALRFVWSVKAFKSGDLGLEIRFQDSNQSIPIALADIPDQEGDEAGQNIVVTGSLILALMLGLMVVLFVRIQRRDNLAKDFDQNEFIYLSDGSTDEEE